jgi:hypothetical protein
MNACISKHSLHTANELTKIFIVRDLSVEKKVGKYYVVIQSAMHF